MGILCEVAQNEYKIKREKNNDFRNLRLNAQYRTDAVYRDCSYEIRALHVLNAKRKKPPKAKVSVLSNLNPSSTWSKVYKSPLPNTRKLHHLEEENTIKHNETPESLDEAFENTKNHFEADKNTIILADSQNTDTPITCGNIFEGGTPMNLKPNWQQTVLPRLLCCFGGEDSLENIKNHSSGETYDSISLSYISNIASDCLNLDASVMSIIDLQRTLKTKQQLKTFTKNVKQAINAFYKDVILELEPQKIKKWFKR